KVGEAFSDPGGDPLAPAPYLLVTVAGTRHRVAPVERTYSPSWSQPFVLDARRLRGDEPVLIQVMDAVDDALIAQVELPVRALLHRASRTFTQLGPIASLDVEIAPTPAWPGRKYELRIPANASLQALLQGTAASWAPIPVMNGETIRIEAAGRVCPSTMSSD